MAATRAVALAALFVLAGAAHAQERTLEIQRFHADLHVRENGELNVTEFITVRFTGSWNGIFRSIPVEYRTERGANYTLFIDVETITDDAGEPLRVERSRSGRNRVFKIWVPGAVDATRTIVLNYAVRNGLRFFEEHDELYWNVTGDESEFPIVNASATVILPPGVAGIRTTAYTGVYGAIDRSVRSSITENVVEFAATRPLAFREGLTVVVGWNPGVVARPTRLDLAGRFLASNLVFGVPILAFLVMFAVWRRWGRDPELRPIVARYEPPEDLRPAEVGTLVDNSPDMRDVTATIVDLAVRGYLVIEEGTEKQFFGLVTNENFTFRLQRDRDSWQELREFERKLLNALFGSGSRTEVTTNALENSFYTHLPGITTELRRSLVRDGHYLRNPSDVRGFFAVLALVGGFIVAVAGAAWLNGVLGQQPGPAILAGFLTGGIILAFGLVMPARTVAGTQCLEAILGFREFLTRVEQPRFEKVIRTPEMFERFLPYAMAFGVEKGWSRAFADIYRTPPDWYRGGHPRGFAVHDFTGNLGRMAAVTGTAMRTAPRSTSGSSGFGGGGGFSGGGFSGGGFGGGRVGGF